MKSHVQIKTREFSQEPLKNITKQLFKEYLSFICYDPLEFPTNVEIKPFNGFQSKEHNLGLLRIPEKDNEPYILYLEQLAIVNKNKEILYHEFTHMMDFVIINNHISFEDKLHNFSFISEVRAKYIEYLYRAGFKNIADNKLLDGTSIILSNFTYKSDTLSFEIKKYYNKIINDINSLYDDFFDVIKQISYYIGFIVFVEKHSNMLIDITQITEKLSYALGKDIETLIKYCKTIPLDFQPIDRSTLITAGTIERSMHQYYIDNHLKK